MTNLPPQPGLLAAFGKADKTRLLMLLVDDQNKPAGPMDARFISQFERGVEDGGGGKLVAGRFVHVAGIKSYERLGSALVGGKQTSTIIRVVPADGKFYHLQAMRFDGDASEDAEIRIGLASFRFIRPPAVSIQSHSAESAAYRIGYLMGRLGGLALLITAAIFIVRAITRRKAKRDSPIPPPLPPSS